MGGRFEISEGTEQDLAAVTDVGIRSKASWDYPEDRMAVFREELTWTSDLVRDRRLFVARDGDRIAGYCSLRRHDDATIELEHLFVDPDYFRLGLGSALFEHAKAQAAAAGGRTLSIVSDPYAAGFYERLGCTRGPDIPSSIPGRTIPTFAVDLRSPE